MSPPLRQRYNQCITSHNIVTSSAEEWVVQTSATSNCVSISMPVMSATALQEIHKREFTFGPIRLTIPQVPNSPEKNAQTHKKRVKWTNTIMIVPCVWDSMLFVINAIPPSTASCKKRPCGKFSCTAQKIQNISVESNHWFACVEREKTPSLRGRESCACE